MTNLKIDEVNEYSYINKELPTYRQYAIFYKLN